MATLQWAEICDHVIEQANGKFGVIGIFSHIHARNFPTEHPDFWIICKVEGMPNEPVQVEISIVGPDGEMLGIIGPLNGKVATQGSAVIAGRIFRPQFPKPGRYEVRIRLAGSPPSSISLTLVQIPSDQGQS